MLRSTRRALVLAILCLCLGLSFIAAAAAHHGSPGHASGPGRASSADAGPPSENAAEQQDGEPEGSDVPDAEAQNSNPDEAEQDGPASEETESEVAEEPTESEVDEDEGNAAAAAETEDENEANAGDAALDLDVTGGGTLVQVGRTLTYGIAVANAGDDPVRDVVVEATLAPELDVVDAGDAQISGSSVTWTLPALAPGADRSLDLEVRVSREGDLRALTDVRVAASDIGDPVTGSLRTFIGAPRGGSVSNPQPRIFEEVTVMRPREVVVRVNDEVLGSTILPVTGIPVGLLAGLGALLIGAGLIALARAGGLLRGTPARLMVVLLLALTACTGDVDTERAAPDPTPAPATSPDDLSDEDEEEDEVLGTVVEPDDAEEDGDGDDGGTDAASSGQGPAEVDEPAVTLQTVTVQDEVVRRRRLDADEIPIRTLGTTAGSNTISLGWTGSDIATAASSAVFVPDAVAEVTTGLGSASGAVDVEITLTNLLPDRRLDVTGRFVHEINGPGGFHSVLDSEAIDVILNPEGTTTYRFTYALPAGDYGLTSRFEANG